MTVQDDDRAITHAIVTALEDLGRDTAPAIAVLRRRGIVNRRLIWSVIALSVVTALCLIAVVITGVQARSNSEELGRVQQRTSDQVLCPLYEVFIQAEKFPPPATYNAEQRAARIEAFKVVQHGYDELDCGKG